MSESWEEKKAREARREAMADRDVAMTRAAPRTLRVYELTPEEERLILVYRRGNADSKDYYLSCMIGWEYIGREFGCSAPPAVLHVVASAKAPKATKRRHKPAELRLV